MSNSSSNSSNEQLTSEAKSASTPHSLSGSLSNSLPRSMSLKNREQIAQIFKNAKRRSASTLTVFYHISPRNVGNDVRAVGCANAEPGSKINSPAKWLVAIPKRTGNAVRRNKIKRSLREAIRLWPQRKKITGEIVVRYNPPRNIAVQGSTKKKQAPLNRTVLHKLDETLIGLLDDLYTKVTSAKVTKTQ